MYCKFKQEEFVVNTLVIVEYQSEEEPQFKARYSYGS